MKKYSPSLRLRLTVLTLISLLALSTWPTAVSLSSPNTCDTPSFAPAQYYNVLHARPYGVAVADFNRDGKPDIVTGASDAYTVAVMLGDGMGGLGAPSHYYIGSTPYFFTTADFNNDGRVDIAATKAVNPGSGIAILLANETGGFQPAQFTPVAGAFNIAAGDINADGNADLVMTQYPDSIAAMLGNGQGGFSAPITSLIRRGTVYALVISEFSADGVPDVAVAGGGLITIFTGNGDGHFTRALRPDTAGGFVDEPYEVGGSIVSITTGYLNNDTEIDLVAASVSSAAGTGDVRVLLGDLGPFFRYDTNFGADNTPNSVAVADFNGDGRDDVAASNEGSDNVSVLLGGAGDFYLFCHTVNFNVKDGTISQDPQGVAVGDFDLDNKPDIVTINQSGNKAVILRNTYGGVSISGRLQDASGQVLSGVTVNLGGAQSATTTTDSGGYYTFNSLTSGANYTVTPVSANSTFRPSSRTYTNLTGFRSANFLSVVNKPSDFDGDSHADLAFWRPGDGRWEIIHSSDYSFGVVPNWGAESAGDVPVPGDYDGDNKTDVAVWRASEGNWYIIRSSDNTVMIQGWGGSGDKPVPADYDGDRKTDFAVYRPTEGNWYIKKSTGGNTAQGWGASDDKPVAADYDGDGKADVAVYRPSEGNWYIRNSSNNATSVRGWGASGDRPVAGDYDGDGKDDIAVFRPSEGNWYIRNSSDNSSRVQGWGGSTDKTVPADYDGDGRTDIAVYRPTEGNWYIILSSTGAGILGNLGLLNDIPVPFAYLPN